MGLIDSRVNTFLVVAESDSFAKASRKLFVSTVSVMKQIDSLESEVGVKLFERSPRGVMLTDAGVMFKRDAERLGEIEDAAFATLRRASRQERRVIRVGTSLLRPCKPIIDLVARKGGAIPYRIEIVPFSDDEASLRNVIDNLGRDIDCIVGPVGSHAFVDHHGVLVLGAWECCIAVGRTDELAGKDRLAWDDLEGRKLMLVREGDSFVIDRMRQEIVEGHPGIEIVNAPFFYDADIFNECDRENVVMETLDVWRDVHPTVVTLPMKWDYRMPYGIVYPQNPSSEVADFIKLLSE